MAIRREEVRHVAELARLELPEEELDLVAAQLSAVLEYVRALDRLDLANCEPLSFAPSESLLREDGPDGRRLAAADALAMAPEVEDGFFVVPAVVENLEP
jgi:aspartyl-tRNA(Asn)/glutamyl-tRNA(Gln) amidotransferase subunit C